jgi:hypothetical protein
LSESISRLKCKWRKDTSGRPPLNVGVDCVYLLAKAEGLSNLVQPCGWNGWFLHPLLSSTNAKHDSRPMYLLYPPRFHSGSLSLRVTVHLPASHCRSEGREREKWLRQALCGCHLLRIDATSLLRFLSLLQHDNNGRFSLLLRACTIAAPHNNNSRFLHLLLSCTSTNMVISLPFTYRAALCFWQSPPLPCLLYTSIHSVPGGHKSAMANRTASPASILDLPGLLQQADYKPRTVGKVRVGKGQYG